MLEDEFELPSQSMDATINGNPYSPADVLEDSLVEFSTEVEIEKVRHSPEKSDEGDCREYDLYHDGNDVEILDIRTDFGWILTAQGDAGLAASVLLYEALEHGRPTELYSDLDVYLSPDGPGRGDYNFEWYTPEALEQGVNEWRMDQHEMYFECEMLALTHFESLATNYLD